MLAHHRHRRRRRAACRRRRCSRACGSCRCCRCCSTFSSVTTFSAPRICCRPSTIAVSAQVPWWRPLSVGSVEDRERALEERIGGVADRRGRQSRSSARRRRRCRRSGANDSRSLVHRAPRRSRCRGRCRPPTAAQIAAPRLAPRRAACARDAGMPNTSAKICMKSGLRGAAARDHDLVERDPELAGHRVDVVLHRQRDRLEDRPVDVGPGVARVEAEHHALAERLVGRREPVEHGHQAVAAGRDTPRPRPRSAPRARRRASRPARRTRGRAGRGTRSASTSRGGRRGSRRGSGAGCSRSSSRTAVGVRWFSLAGHHRGDVGAERDERRRLAERAHAPRPRRPCRWRSTRPGGRPGCRSRRRPAAVIVPDHLARQLRARTACSRRRLNCSQQRGVVAPLPRVGVDRPLQQDVVRGRVPELAGEAMREVAGRSRRVRERRDRRAGRAGRRGRPSS